MVGIRLGICEMNFKRKRPRRQVRWYSFHHPWRWLGNSKGRKSFRDEKLAVIEKEQLHG